MSGPGFVFSKELDARDDVKAWMAGLSEKDRRAMRDDVTPLFKEVPADADVLDRKRERGMQDASQYYCAGSVRAPGHAAKVRASLLQEERARVLRLETERDRAVNGDSIEAPGARRAILVEAIELLPLWQFRPFAAWFRGENRNRIAKDLGVSRWTVRRAIDGDPDTLGAIAILVEALKGDETFKKAVEDMASKAKEQRRAFLRTMTWFAGIDNKPDMVMPLAMLMVLDDLSDAKREVKVADVLPHFPRSLVTPCLRLLKAYGYAASDGHTIKIHKVPHSEEAA